MRTSTYILAITFVILLGLVIITGQCNKQRAMSDIPDNYLNVDSLSVNKIKVHHPSGTTVLKKTKNKWNLVEPITYSASQKSIERLLSEAINMNLVSMISDKEEKHSLFAVDTSGTRVEFLQNNELLDEIIIGKMSPAGGITYVRKPESEKVYQAAGMLKSVFAKETDNWREKQILDMDKQAIKQLDYNYGTDQFSIVRQDTAWVLIEDGNPTMIDEKKVDPVLSSVSSFRITDFIDNPSPEELAKFSSPHAVMSIYEFNSQQPIQLYFVEAENNNRFLIKLNNQQDTIFSTYKGSGQRILKEKDHFLKK